MPRGRRHWAPVRGIRRRPPGPPLDRSSSCAAVTSRRSEPGRAGRWGAGARAPRHPAEARPRACVRGWMPDPPAARRSRSPRCRSAPRRTRGAAPPPSPRPPAGAGSRARRCRSRGRRCARDRGVLVEDRRVVGGRGGLREPPGLLIQRTDGAGRHVQFPTSELGLRPLDEGEGHLPRVASLAQRIPLQARRLHPARGQSVHDELAQDGRILLPADAARLRLVNRPGPLGQDGTLETAHVLDIHAGGGGDFLGAGARAHEGLEVAGADGRAGAGRLDDLRQRGRARPAHGRAQGVVDDDAVALAPTIGHHDGVTVSTQQLEVDHGYGPPRVRHTVSACHPRRSGRGRSPGVPWTGV